MEWQMRAIRGATTASENTVEAMREVVTELLDELENRNQFQPTDMISVTFSVTRDLDTIFPAAIARSRPGWDNVAMLDVQQMHVEGSLQRCIRFLIHAYLPASASVHHIYLRNAASLRPDWSLPQSLQTSQPAVKSKV
ncbi:MAG: chorismate mutase [Nostoc sp. NMS1]|uniref:chorismate mutase n=2 Tax=Nostoc TaxID=1177 RepID=UPI0025F92A69|nr:MULTISPECIES: chorismate mutase [unclassified Nostoc]MBN3910696.1 chorismate mutase [Nostoc sp. NMS1]MBN3992762.1 chorismate mutase [Nostoc sp. NMS2]